jgi:acetolactate synthase-1/2/3 large subunit
MAITADLKPFLAALDNSLQAWEPSSAHRDWLAWCKERLARYPDVQARQREFKGRINPYHFVERLFRDLDGTDIVACGNATTAIVPFRADRIKPGMRMFSNSGRIMMNLQEITNSPFPVMPISTPRWPRLIS